MVKTAFTSEQIWLIFIRQRSPVNSDTWFASDRWSNGVAFGTVTVLLASVTHCNVSSRGSFFGNLKLFPGVYYPTWTSICSSFCYWKGYSSYKNITSLVTCFSDIHLLRSLLSCPSARFTLSSWFYPHWARPWKMSEKCSTQSRNSYLYTRGRSAYPPDISREPRFDVTQQWQHPRGEVRMYS